MSLLSVVLIGIVAFEHFYFLILEMFLWTTPKGIKIFGLKSKQFAEDTKVLAANQGLYNGFLSVGLVFTLIKKNITIGILFLIFVIIAGIYGAYSTKQIKLFYFQSIPAILALITLFL